MPVKFLIFVVILGVYGKNLENLQIERANILSRRFLGICY
jgi:hypothetical protein